jgi:hypothetical protein
MAVLDAPGLHPGQHVGGLIGVWRKFKYGKSKYGNQGRPRVGFSSQSGMFFLSSVQADADADSKIVQARPR